MRYIDIDSINDAREKALAKYENAKKKLHEPLLSQDFALAAQEANDAWLEFKKIDIDFRNSSILKTMGEVYDC